MRLPVFRADDTRPTLTRVGRLAVQARALARLPRPVRAFYVRALWTALSRREQYSLDVVTRPDDLRRILELAGQADRVVELGTATGWTTVALALARPTRSVVTYDPVVRPQRELYLQLVAPDVRQRITFVHGPGRGATPTDGSVGFLFVDGSHEREDTMTTFHVWHEAIAPGGRIVFHDYRDPHNPGITEAVEGLGLAGRQEGRMFVWTAGDPVRAVDRDAPAGER